MVQDGRGGRPMGVGRGPDPPAVPKAGCEPTNVREILNTILYQNHTGCQWDMLPHDLSPKSTAYGYYKAWQDQGVWELIVDTLRGKIRVTTPRVVEAPAEGPALADAQTEGRAVAEAQREGPAGLVAMASCITQLFCGCVWPAVANLPPAAGAGLADPCGPRPARRRSGRAPAGPRSPGPTPCASASPSASAFA